MEENTYKTIIHFAPLQGYTDRAYRYAYDSFFSGVDYYYTPYLDMDKLNIENKQDINIQGNKFDKKKLIPQILPSSIDEIKLLCNYVKTNNYSCVNINCGCPYPMVIRKGRGAALLENPELVRDFVNCIRNDFGLDVSLKVRSGMLIDTEILSFLEIVGLENINNIIVHPRTAKQLYKGFANTEVFNQCCTAFPETKFIYNGDITSFEIFHEYSQKLKSTDELMIGRGILKDPFLPMKIKSNGNFSPSNFINNIVAFIRVMIAEIIADSKNEGHALNRLKYQILFLLDGKPELKKNLKKIKKAKAIAELEGYVSEMLWEK